MLVSIAFKNMLRYKRRTLVTSCAVAFGVMFSIVFNGFLAGMNNESTRNLIDYETSGAKFRIPATDYRSGAVFNRRKFCKRNRNFS